MTAEALLLAALATCPDIGPCVIHLEPGIYPHNQMIHIKNLNDTTIFGDGVIWEMDEGPIDCTEPPWLKLSYSHHVRVSGLTIIDKGTNSFGCREQSHGITTRHSTHITIDHVKIIGVGDEAIQFGGGEFNSLTDSELGKCARETTAYAACVVIAGSRFTRVTGNNIHDNLTEDEYEPTKNRKAGGVRIEASDRYDSTVEGAIITDNFFHMLDAGIVISVTNDVDAVAADNNIFHKVARPFFIRAFRGASITNVEKGTMTIMEPSE